MDVSQLVAAGADGTGRREEWAAGWDEPTLLEALLASLARDPKRLDQAARLIDDLRRTPEGADLLPPDLDRVWAAVWKIRQELAG